MSQPGQHRKDWLQPITAGLILLLIVIGTIVYWQRSINYTSDTTVFKKNPPATIVQPTREPVRYLTNTPTIPEGE